MTRNKHNKHFPLYESTPKTSTSICYEDSKNSLPWGVFILLFITLAVIIAVVYISVQNNTNNKNIHATIAPNNLALSAMNYSRPILNSIFSAGNGGASGRATITNSPGSSGGGGGAGGIIVQSPVGGIHEVFNSMAGSGRTQNTTNVGGNGGIGLGAGGGGAGCWVGQGGSMGGTGNDGFVYVLDDNALITKTEMYTVISNNPKITFILMGGGGGGGGWLAPNNTSVISTGGCGGCSGNLLINSAVSSSSGSVFSITIGSGGLSGNNGGNTSVVGITNPGVSITVAGGYTGNNILTSYNSSSASVTIATLPYTSIINDTNSYTSPSNAVGSAVGAPYTIVKETTDTGSSISQNIITQLNNI